MQKSGFVARPGCWAGLRVAVVPPISREAAEQIQHIPPCAVEEHSPVLCWLDK